MASHDRVTVTCSDSVQLLSIATRTACDLERVSIKSLPCHISHCQVNGMALVIM